MHNLRQQHKNQRGHALLVSILMMLTLSLMMLKALHYQQENALLMMFDEQKYLNAFQQAESSLAWGSVQSWPLHSRELGSWICLQKSGSYLQSCLRRYQDDLFLLKGIASFSAGEHLELYQWMKQMKGSNQDTLTPVISGWLDFCPVIPVEFCL
ncbi:YgdB family protein [Xenorhabdus siamensis]|uniref:YgdB family protein n=1 Tax=Xenorhabdus siamensis TaxID=3136254 RepID=UPI0030F45E50